MMNEVKKLFDKEFVLKINTQFRGGGAETVHLEALTPDSTKNKQTKLVEGSGHEVGYVGSYNFLGSLSKEDEFVDSVGKLAVVRTYQQEPDDMLGAYLPVYTGFAVVDRNQKIAYTNTSNRNRVLEDKYDVTQLLYIYGPCALALTEAADFDNRKYVETIESTFQERIAELKKRGVEPAKVEAEEAKFKAAVDMLKAKSLEAQNSAMQF